VTAASPPTVAVISPVVVPSQVSEVTPPPAPTMVPSADRAVATAPMAPQLVTNYAADAAMQHRYGGSISEPVMAALLSASIGGGASGSGGNLVGGGWNTGGGGWNYIGGGGWNTGGGGWNAGGGGGGWGMPPSHLQHAVVQQLRNILQRDQISYSPPRMDAASAHLLIDALFANSYRGPDLMRPDTPTDALVRELIRMFHQR
jgi:hypothetical protein